MLIVKVFIFCILAVAGKTIVTPISEGDVRKRGTIPYVSAVNNRRARHIDACNINT